AVTVAVFGNSPMTASMATDLPEPLSPTMARTSRSSTCRSMPRTAKNWPTEVSKDTDRLRISSSAMISAPRQLRVERIAQPVADEVDGQHRDQDRKSREGHHPPGTQDELPRLGQHRSPFRGWRLRPEAQEAEGGGVEDGGREAQRRLYDQRRQAI